ncbi:MAG: YiiD C-terminal domain-containing protein [Deltaproteobacteria bacterium]|nr:YiiD C-terminal domain-containing protein [Deltaproteobacteria bacterium]
MKHLEGSVEIVKKMGLKAVDLRPRNAKLMLPIKQNRNHIGTIYAGSIFTPGEMAGGVIFLVSFDYEKFYPIVKEITIRYTRPATTDMTVEVEMTDEKVTRFLKTLE